MKRILALLLAFLLPASALADPLPLAEDLSGTITVLYDEEDPSAGRYEYTYRYPYADPADPTAYQVNTFFEYLVRDTEVYTVPNLSDYYRSIGQSVTVTVTYDITFNGDDFFSVRVHRNQDAGKSESVDIWEGYTFSRLNGMPGNVFSLSQILGVLEAGESDSWLEERQSGKVREAVWSLVWNMIEENPENIPYDPALTREDLESGLDPDLQFWLDETGNPVFFLRPGFAADEEAGLLTFPLTLEEIEDEL